ncbi:immunoglobulin domain-containing family protein [Spirosoma endbachense]|uniref:Uncharacterized protein n=1 Tax=Spirosoma endbachense TaxID=2666025 RepID=A0A6P1VNT8_9BACT|nr:hypothetical protein [Spirosoma endbachense]QHV94921.1 hypothetical protein GJR95_07765 [Spirosoma endbachense]
MLGYHWTALCLAMLTFTSRYNSYAQAKKQENSFPTYQQIKPKDSEIIDQVSPPSSSTIYSRIINTSSARFPLNLFDYPAGTVTYYLNNQPTTDVKYVKEVLNNKSISVETISVDKPTEDGKRIIRIRYEAL